MTLKLGQEQIRWLRLRANGLTESREDSVVSIVARACALQAQERSAAELAVQPRARDAGDGGPRLSDVRVALDGLSEGQPDIVRTWAMRGTIHLLAAEDVGWMLPLLGPVFVKTGARRRRQLGLDDAICARATALMRDYLDGRKALTREELAQKLGAAAIPVQGQALYHLLYRAGLEGVICFGPDRDGEHTFVLLQPWLGIGALSEAQEGASARLAQRYLRGYGPATAGDFARWSGLGIRRARKAFEELQTPVLEAQGPEGETLTLLVEQATWLDEPQGERLESRLLPAYDSFLLGYESRDFLVAEAYARQIHPGGGVIHPTVLLNGQAAGVWRLRRRQEKNVEITPFEPFNKAESEAVALAVASLRNYIQTSSS